MSGLDLDADVVDLTAALVDVESVSGSEDRLATMVETALRAAAPWLDVWRAQNSVVARTTLGRPERVVVAGHLDTVPVNANLPSRRTGDLLHGLGSCDMKGGVAVALKLAAALREPSRDVTYVWYEAEEVEEARNGLKMLAGVRPEVLDGDLAVVMEPTNGAIEAGCQGSLRVEVAVAGTRAHSARWWNGSNAVHAAGEVLQRLRDYRPREPVVDGLRFREGLNAVGIRGGVAGNVIPDACTVTVNYRFAPDRTLEEAENHLRDVFDGFPVTVTDRSPAAQPGLDRPAAQAFVAAVGGSVNPKFGWTDVARFSALGVPAVNYGPGDPEVAHSQGEHVPVDQIRQCLERMTAWLS